MVWFNLDTAFGLTRIHFIQLKYFSLSKQFAPCDDSDQPKHIEVMLKDKIYFYINVYQMSNTISKPTPISAL